MTAITVIGLIVTIWGVLTSLATLLQAEKIAKAHTAEGVSVSFHEVRSMNFVILILFGVVTGNIFLIIPNAVGLIASLTTIMTAVHFH